ncbi:MAG: putative rane protein, partial [Pseudarthrobacter sp.]|nr:putative rane protein [Pseudarthrobacter sp.]
MSSLTDMYVAQVVRHLPEKSRPDIARELKATLADMVEERLANDGGPAAGAAASNAAERAAVEELGDPARLALQYQDAPQYLIGPELFPAYVRLARWLLPMVALIAAVVNAVVYATTEPGAAIGGMIGTIVGNSAVALLIATGVVTTLFAIGERVLPEKDKAEMNKSVSYVDWNADHLYEDAPSRRISRSETITALIFLVIMALMPVVPSTFFYVGHLNDAGSFVNPELWDGWIPAYFAFLAALMVVEAWKLSAGRWPAPILWTGLLVDAAFAVFLTAAVLTQDVLDPRLF